MKVSVLLGTEGNVIYISETESRHQYHKGEVLISRRVFSISTIDVQKQIKSYTG